MLIAWPIYVVVQMSLRPGKALALSELMSRPLGLANYDRVLHQQALWDAFGHSAVYTIGSLAPAFLAGLLFALLFHRAFPARRWLRSLLLLPWAVPGVVVSITFLWMLDASYGVFNAILRDLGVTGSDIAWFVDARTAMAAVIVPTVWKSFPFFTITLLAALQSIPSSLYEAARVDGASAWQQFVHVTWPGIKRPALLAVLLNALWTFREFDIIYAATRRRTGGRDGNAWHPGLSRGVRKLPIRHGRGDRRTDARHCGYLRRACRCARFARSFGERARAIAGCGSRSRGDGRARAVPGLLDGRDQPAAVVGRAVAPSAADSAARQGVVRRVRRSVRAATGADLDLEQHAGRRRFDGRSRS